MRRLTPVLRAGQLRKRLAFKSPPAARDSFGGSADLSSNSLDGWVDVCTVSGSVAPWEGRELEAAAKPTAEVTTVIEIRWRVGIDSTMRILQAETGQIYDIRAVMDVDGRKRKISILCRERI